MLCSLRRWAAAVAPEASASAPSRMLPWESVTVTSATLRPGTAMATSLVTPLTWPGSSSWPALVAITTAAVVGCCSSVNSCSSGMAILTVADWTGSRRLMVRDSSPSVARTRLTRLVKSVAPRLDLSKISKPTPPPSSRLEEARSRRAWSRSDSGTCTVLAAVGELVADAGVVELGGDGRGVVGARRRDQRRVRRLPGEAHEEEDPHDEEQHGAHDEPPARSGEALPETRDSRQAAHRPRPTSC